MSETTVKLFAVPVRCYRSDNLEPVIGAWTDPYFESQIGIGFSGSCFEALTLIAHFSRMLCALVAVEGNEPLPKGAGIVNLMAMATKTYFSKHTLESKPEVYFLVFGYEEGRPWVGEISWIYKTKQLKQTFEFATDDTLKCIGDSPLAQQRMSSLTERIRRHREGVSTATDEGELESERHLIAERKAAEEEVLQSIENEFMTSIGGTLQRLELCCSDGKVSVGYTQDDQDYLDHASYSVSTEAPLGPVPIVEKMGRRVQTKAGIP